MSNSARHARQLRSHSHLVPRLVNRMFGTVFPTASAAAIRIFVATVGRRSPVPSKSSVRNRSANRRGGAQ
jgi:hypothetical protein